MRLFFAYGVIVAISMTTIFSVLAANEEPEATGEDSSAGLPGEYAKNYLTASSTVSPDKKFAVIYPTLKAEEAADDANLCGLFRFHPFAVSCCTEQITGSELQRLDAGRQLPRQSKSRTRRVP